LAAHASPAGHDPHPAHDHHHHHAHDGHDHGTARPVAVVSALTASAAGRLLVAGGLAATLWLLVLWAML